MFLTKFDLSKLFYLHNRNTNLRKKLQSDKAVYYTAYSKITVQIGIPIKFENGFLFTVQLQIESRFKI